MPIRVPPETTARRVGLTAIALASICLVILHVSPAPTLVSATGATYPYQLTNFLSEYVRTQYAPVMLLCFFLLGIAALCAAFVLRPLRRESVCAVIAGVSLLLLGVLPTDLTGGREAATLVGRVHNPLSTLVFLPVFCVALSLCIRARREPRYRAVARLSMVCGALIVCGIVGASIYEAATGWQGRWWTGLMQRSVVLPLLVWMAGLLVLVDGRRFRGHERPPL